MTNEHARNFLHLRAVDMQENEKLFHRKKQLLGKHSCSSIKAISSDQILSIIREEKSASGVNIRQTDRLTTLLKDYATDMRVRVAQQNRIPLSLLLNRPFFSAYVKQCAFRSL